MKFGMTGVSTTWMFVMCSCGQKKKSRDICQIFACGWALDALNYLAREFWKLDQMYRAWTLPETLYFFDLRLSNFRTVYQDAFDGYLIEEEEIEKAALQCEIEKTMFESDLADREELPRPERTQQIGKMKDVQVTTDIFKSVMTATSAKGSSTKQWPAIKDIGFWSKCGAQWEASCQRRKPRKLFKE